MSGRMPALPVDVAIRMRHHAELLPTALSYSSSKSRGGNNSIITINSSINTASINTSTIIIVVVVVVAVDYIVVILILSFSPNRKDLVQLAQPGERTVYFFWVRQNIGECVDIIKNKKNYRGSKYRVRFKRFRLVGG